MSKREVNMTQPQIAIVPEANNFAKFAVFKVHQNHAQVLEKLQALPAMIDELNQEQQGAQLTLAISFSHDFWSRLNQNMPPELETFTPLGKGNVTAPATDADVMLHMHSARPDLHFYILRSFMNQVREDVTMLDESDAFRYLDSRDMTGFEDGTENPKGDERAQVALIQEGEFAGGSYMMWQRYVHKLAAWERLSIAQQEKVIGRTKPDSVELDNVPPKSHVGRVDLKEDGKGLKIVRHSLPYGQVSGEHGLVFIAYCNRLYNFKTMLESMYGHSDQHQDIMLNFTDAVTGAYFFTPSQEMLASLKVS